MVAAIVGPPNGDRSAAAAAFAGPETAHLRQADIPAGVSLWPGVSIPVSCALGRSGVSIPISCAFYRQGISILVSCALGKPGVSLPVSCAFCKCMFILRLSKSNTMANSSHSVDKA